MFSFPRSEGGPKREISWRCLWHMNGFLAFVSGTDSSALWKEVFKNQLLFCQTGFPWKGAPNIVGVCRTTRKDYLWYFSILLQQEGTERKATNDNFSRQIQYHHGQHLPYWWSRVVCTNLLSLPKAACVIGFHLCLGLVRVCSRSWNYLQLSCLRPPAFTWQMSIWGRICLSQLPVHPLRRMLSQGLVSDTCHWGYKLISLSSLEEGMHCNYANTWKHSLSLCQLRRALYLDSSWGAELTAENIYDPHNLCVTCLSTGHSQVGTVRLGMFTWK